MYSTLNVYGQQKRKQFKTNHQDSFLKTSNCSFSFKNKDNEEVRFYQKLDALDNILDGYDVLKIAVLERQEMRSERIDYSKLYKYLHQAVYLDDDVLYLEATNHPKMVLTASSPSIIELFCFIYTEIKTELEEKDTIPNKAFELAAQFKQKYLQPNAILFDEAYFTDILRILRETLEVIKTQTVYKDNDFWHFYDAIANFLNGETQYDAENIYFGINPFYDVWEDICRNVILHKHHQMNELLLVDGHEDRFQLLKPTFTLKLNDGNKERRIRPDLILDVGIDGYSQDEIMARVCVMEISTHIEPNGRKHNNQKVVSWHITDDTMIQLYSRSIKNRSPKFRVIFEADVNTFKKDVVAAVKNNKDLAKSLNLYCIQIIDFKYICLHNLKSNKIAMDIQKQLLYEWAIQQQDAFKNYKTVSEFWVPYYHKDDNESFYESVNSDFKKIKLKKIDFKSFQQIYVNLFK
jgi:hypothetical protein